MVDEATDQRREEPNTWLGVEYSGMRPGAANNYYYFLDIE
jgi:hypothetical protein